MAITLAAPDEFASHYIADGTVKVKDFDVRTAWENGASVYRSAFTEPAYDIIILPLSNFLIARDKGMALVGVPVFIDLFFPQIAIRVNRRSGIKSPKELEGKRVGVRGFAFNPAVWVRGGLSDVYGVQLDMIQWVVAEPNSLSGVDVAAVPGYRIETGADLVADLENGKLDAVLWDRGGPEPTEHTANLFGDPLGEALKYHQQTGVFPMNSMLVARREVIDANPGLGQAVVDASDEARELYYANVADDADHMGLPVKWLRANGLFPHRNGVANNRVALEAIIRYASEQGIIDRRPVPEELFFVGAK